MMTKKTVLNSSIALVLAATASTACADDTFNYSYIEVDYLVQDVDIYQDSDTVSEFLDETDEGGGFQIEASFGFADNWFGFASYSDTESDFTFTDDNGQPRPQDTDVTTLKLGVGFHTPIHNRMDFVASAAYMDVDLGQFELGATDSDLTDPDITLADAYDDLNEDFSDGYTVDAGVRAQTADWIELGGGLRYTNLDSGDDVAAFANALFEINEQIGINVSAVVGDDLNIYGIGARYSF